ncbi:MAG: two-component regulator propeller domain-containing protein [Pyrinomonadaceae bacterium]
MKLPRAPLPTPVRRWLSCLCWLVVAAAAVRAERLPVRVYTTAEGLSSSAVNWVMRDSRGLLWFGTRDGLSRFDGQEFTSYRVGRDASPSITQIIERRGGDYLALTQTGALYRFDAQTPASSAGNDDDATLTLEAELLAEGLPGLLYEDRAGRLWMAGNAAGLVRMAETGGRLTAEPVDLGLPRAEGEPAVEVTRVIEARDESMWLVAGPGLVRRAPDGRVVLYRAPSAAPMNAFLSGLYEDSEGRIWVGSRRGFYVLRPRPLDDPAAFREATLPDSPARPQRFAPPEAPGGVVAFRPAGGFDSDLVFEIVQTGDGRIWLTNDGGLSVFDGRELRSFDASNGLGQKMGMMAEDSDGNLWLASMNGALKLVTRGLSTYGKDDGLGGRVIQSLYQSSSGELYVVSGDWRVSRLDGGRFHTARPFLGDSSVPLWTSNAAFLDSAGAWWFLTEKRLYRFDHAGSLESLGGRAPSAVYHTGAGFNHGAFYRMFEDSRGRIWVSTRTGDPARMGLSLWRRETGDFQHFGDAEGFPAGRAPSAFSEDRAGNIWVGFYHGGAARYSNGRFTLWTESDGLPAGYVVDMRLDRSGRLWLATVGGGLIRVDDPAAERPTFVRYTTAEGLSSNNVRAITEDEEGRIYAGTVRGVDRLSPDTGRVKHYTTADGLADEFVTVAFRDRGGALWFGTQNGLSRLAPEPDPPAPDPPILIGHLRVAGVKLPVSELGQESVGRLELDYTQANLQIGFFSLSFAPAERMRYQHKLEGADADWSGPAAERTVSYANLAPGSYRFLVRAVNADGVASRAPAAVSFRISPPVWARWWFAAGALVIFGAVVYAFARAVYRRKLELERIRTRIASDLHDDIGASLTRIAMLSEVAQRQDADRASGVAHRLAQIAEDARAVIDSMSDIVWAIDPRRDDFASVVERVRSFASDTLGAAGVRWQMHVAPQLEHQHLSPEQRRALYMIFKEAVSNVARHADCRRASCRITFEHHALVAVFEDDGRGLPAEAQSNGRGGRGLENMRARAEGLGGRLEVESEPGAGTRLRLVLPLRRADMNMLLRLGRG